MFHQPTLRSHTRTSLVGIATAGLLGLVVSLAPAGAALPPPAGTAATRPTWSWADRETTYILGNA